MLRENKHKTKQQEKVGIDPHGRKFSSTIVDLT